MKTKRFFSILLASMIFFSLLTPGRMAVLAEEPFYTEPMVAAGHNHNLGLKYDGTVWAWGFNWAGQLGDNTTIDRVAPVQVQNLSDVVAIAAGSSHSLALKSDGTVWAWGNNNHGQLGADANTYDHRPIPAQVQNLSGVTAIAANTFFSLALKNDGTVWAWGDNRHGQLGDNTTICRHTPAQVQSLSEVTAIAAGPLHCVALRNDGTVWTWGDNSQGQLGDGTTIGRSVPIRSGELDGITAIAAGSSHTIMLKNDGSIWGSGRGMSPGDQLSFPFGPQRPVHTPTQRYGLEGVIAIDSRGFMLRNDGTVLFQGTPVPGLNNIIAISSRYIALALRNDGSVWSVRSPVNIIERVVGPGGEGYLNLFPSLVIYAITFDANGGTNAPALQQKNRGIPLTLTTDRPSREGYIFMGWATSATADTPQYQPGDLLATDADMTLYAVWAPESRRPALPDLDSLQIGDVFEFGTYPATLIWGNNPQTDPQRLFGRQMIIDPALYAELESRLTGNTTVVDYRSSPGASTRYGAVSEYEDVWHNGTQYRMLVFRNIRWASWVNVHYWFRFEPVTWRVLAIEDDAVFVLAEHCLDAVPWALNNGDVSWEDSMLREFMNSEMLNTLFLPREQTIITDSILADVGTTDKLFALSREEVLSNAYAFTRRAPFYAYATARGNQGYSGTTHANWWTRTQQGPNQVFYVDMNGHLQTDRNDGNRAYGFGNGSGSGPRPAMRLQRNNVEPIITYTITFNANGGEGAPGPAIKIHNIPFLFNSVDEPTREGYHFLGWSTRPHAAAPQFTSDSSYTANADITLYAIWQPEAYQLLFFPGGGAPPLVYETYRDATFYLRNVLVQNPERMSREGFTFLGWAEGAETNEISYLEDDIVVFNEPRIFYAVWEFSLLFFPGDNQGAIEYRARTNQAFDLSNLLAEHAERFSREGSIFLGWANAPRANEPQYLPADSILFNGPQNLYAVWVFSENVIRDDDEEHVTVRPASSFPDGTEMVVTTRSHMFPIAELDGEQITLISFDITFWHNGVSGIQPLDENGNPVYVTVRLSIPQWFIDAGGNVNRLIVTHRGTPITNAHTVQDENNGRWYMEFKTDRFSLYELVLLPNNDSPTTPATATPTTTTTASTTTTLTTTAAPTTTTATTTTIQSTTTTTSVTTQQTSSRNTIFSTRYEANIFNWILFFLGFGWFWMWF